MNKLFNLLKNYPKNNKLTKIK